VFFHHSDVPQAIRHYVEKHCRTTPTEGSEIVFSTETLTFGVNLAVDDVVLFGTEFNTSDRFRKSTSEPLSVCNFHNMAGRAGRLGKGSAQKPASVYIVVPGDDKSPELTIVDRYYKKIEPLRSMLFISEDKVALDRNVRKPEYRERTGCDRFGDLKATDFSYPFVRAVLDVLRHKNIHGGSGMVLGRNTAKDVQEFFEELSLYGEQNFGQGRSLAESKPERDMFRCAIRSILADCATLALVTETALENADPTYQITERGQAIIDTGTEIETIAPMLLVYAKVRKAWDETHPGEPIPSELLLLVLVGLKEIYRNHFNRTPEFRRPRPAEEAEADENAPASPTLSPLHELFLKTLEKFAPNARPLFDKLIPALEETLPPEPQFDLVSLTIRFFIAMVGWVSDMSRLETVRVIKGEPKGDDALPGFRNYIDQLQWKTVCLQKLLVSDVSTRELGQLLFLPMRIRYGSASEAVPLFASRGFRPKRDIVRELLRLGRTPARLLAAPENATFALLDREVKDAALLARIRERLSPTLNALRRHARQSLRDLVEAFAANDETERLAAIGGVLRELGGQSQDKRENLFQRAIVDYSEIESQRAPNFDERLRKRLLHHESELAANQSEAAALASRPRGQSNDHYIIELERPRSGPGLDAHLYHYPSEADAEVEGRYIKPDEYQRVSSVRVVPFQFKSNWKASPGAGHGWKPFSDWLAKLAHDVDNLAVVAFPWFPDPTLTDARPIKSALERFRSDGAATFMTPAAFAAFVLFPTRGLIRPERAMRLLTREPSGGRLYQSLGVRDVLEAAELDAPRDARLIFRERIITHFEVTPPDTLD
jgi:hypothetical protein